MCQFVAKDTERCGLDFDQLLDIVKKSYFLIFWQYLLGQLQTLLCQKQHLLGQTAFFAGVAVDVLLQQRLQRLRFCNLHRAEDADRHATAGVCGQQALMAQLLHGLPHGGAANAKLLGNVSVLQVGAGLPPPL